MSITGACRNRLITSLLCLVALTGTSTADELPTTPLHLADCLRIAHERRATLLATRADLALALDQLHALESLGPAADLVRRDLHVRIQQSRIGVDIARTNLEAAEREASNLVARFYYTVQYARMQLHEAEAAIRDLEAYRESIRTALKLKKADWGEVAEDLVTLTLQTVLTGRNRAEKGLAEAQAALLETMGLAPPTCLIIAEEPLPEPNVAVCREEILSLTLARNALLRQAELAEQIVHLEIDAQAAICLPGSVPTFASGSDIHAVPITAGSHGDHYRPRPLALEMPNSLAGPRDCRVQCARDLDARADAMVLKTHNLLALDAEITYQTWREATLNLAQRREALAVGERVIQRFQKAILGGEAVIELLANHNVLAHKIQADYNELLWQQIMALLQQERVTADGFRSGLVPAVACSE
jgi:hypothetical protein